MAIENTVSSDFDPRSSIVKSIFDIVIVIALVFCSPLEEMDQKD